MSKNFIGLEAHVTDNYIDSLAGTSMTEKKMIEHAEKVRKWWLQALKGDKESLFNLCEEVAVNASIIATREENYN